MGVLTQEYTEPVITVAYNRESVGQTQNSLTMKQLQREARQILGYTGETEIHQYILQC